VRPLSKEIGCISKPLILWEDEKELNNTVVQGIVVNTERGL